MKAALWSRLWKSENGRPQAQPDEVANLDAVATSLGLDHDKLVKDLEGCQQWLQSGQRELAAVGVNATPAFFVNGRPLRERSFAAFDKLVSEELAKANHSSVAAADYYEREILGKGLKQVKSRFAD
jgi:protein-disulfide isomerase